jgi:hypothetical protein
LINRELPFTLRFPSKHLLSALLAAFSHPSGGAQRFSSSSLSAINSAFFYEKVV